MYGRKARTRTDAFFGAPLVPAGSHSFCSCSCLPVSISLVPCTANSSTQKTKAVGSSQMYLSTHLRSITSQKTVTLVSVKQFAPVRTKWTFNDQHFGKHIETDLPCWQKFPQLNDKGTENEINWEQTLMFCWPCIVIYQHNRSNNMHYLHSVYFD
jgi:hypothetical protein